MKFNGLLSCFGALSIFGMAGSAVAVDEKAAETLARRSKCLICHSVDKKKEGPPFREVAAKYKGHPEAVDKLTRHVTVPSKVKIDGEEQDHGLAKTSDPAEVRNLVDWVLSR